MSVAETAPDTSGYTDAQLRALLHLRPDGDWTTIPHRLSAAMTSLRRASSAVVIGAVVVGRYSPADGRMIYRLTEFGLAERARIYGSYTHWGET
jgi:hypothetical protein